MCAPACVRGVCVAASSRARSTLCCGGARTGVAATPPHTISATATPPHGLQAPHHTPYTYTATDRAETETSEGKRRDEQLATGSAGSATHLTLD